MGAVSTPLVDEARSIFEDLGYEVEHTGDELRATRKWREVYVTTASPAEAETHGRLRCFVAERDRADRVRDQLERRQPAYDWAVVGVTEDGYEVLHPNVDLTAP
ncbi:MAG: hypothetical protein ABEI11_00405 [Haloarculaceae archaeon]